MKDKLLFGTIGLLVGIVVMQWTMQTTMASYVSPTTGIVAADGIAPGRVDVLDQNGVQWYCTPTGWFNQVNLPALPVPVASLKFWAISHLVTQDNHVWVKDPDNNNAWHDCGVWPGSPVAAEQSTWGKVKAKFSGKGDKQ